MVIAGFSGQLSPTHKNAQTNEVAAAARQSTPNSTLYARKA